MRGQLAIKYAAFVVVFLMITSLCYTLSNRIEPVYPILTQRYQQLFDQQKSVKAITIGSSHSVAIDFPSIQLSGYHLWDFGEDLFESEFKTRYILTQLPELKVVFLTLPFPIFVHDNEHAGLDGMYRNRTKLHFISANFKLIDDDIGAFVKGKLAPVARYDHWVFLPKHLLQDQAAIIPVKETLSIELLAEDGNMRGEVAGFENKANLEEIALLRLNDHLRYIAKTVALEPHIIPKTRAALGEINAILKQRGIKLILYTPPFYESYLQHFPKDLHQQFQEDMTTLCQKEDLLYFNYSADPTFIHEAKYFQDGNHLSTAGAKAFSERFGNDLRDSGLIPR